jgi:hypothetical protein
MVVGTTYAISAHQHLSCKLRMAFYSIQHYVPKVVNGMQHAKRFLNGLICLFKKKVKFWQFYARCYVSLSFA